MKLKLLITVSVALLVGATTHLFAQATGGATQGGGGTAGAAAGGKNAEASSGVGKYANYDRIAAQQVGGIRFIGKVVVDGGLLPWDPILVSVTCDGKTRYNTPTDAKGGFEIHGARKESEIGGQPGKSDQVTAAQLSGCQVHADLSGYRSNVLTIPGGNIMDNPDIGTISLHADERASGTAVSATTAAASKDAMKKFDSARAKYIQKNFDGAQKDLEKAVQIDPKFAEAWYQLGKLQQPQKPQDALASYQKAVAADPQFVSPYEPIAELAAIQKNWQQVVDATTQSLKLDPTGSPQIWYYDALGHLNTNDSSVAEESAKKSLAMDPQHLAPNDEQLLAVIEAGRGQFQDALDHLRNCLNYTPPGPNADLMKQQIAQLEKVAPPAAK
jgi:cytochrome c-type biogenesis protein CcmH/NrfG